MIVQTSNYNKRKLDKRTREEEERSTKLSRLLLFSLLFFFLNFTLLLRYRRRPRKKWGTKKEEIKNIQKQNKKHDADGLWVFL